MKRFIFLALLLPASAQSWELMFPGQPNGGAVSLTTITDIITVRSNTGVDPVPVATPAYWISFADSDVSAICAAMGAAQFQGRYVYLDAAGRPQDPPIMLPMALFAKANNLPLRVKISNENAICRVHWMQTCTADGACPGMP